MRRVVAVATKELHQIVRDQRTLAILLLFPAFILLIYGYALNFDIRDVRLAVQDHDRSTACTDVPKMLVFSTSGIASSAAIASTGCGARTSTIGRDAKISLSDFTVPSAARRPDWMIAIRWQCSASSR